MIGFLTILPHGKPSPNQIHSRSTRQKVHGHKFIAMLIIAFISIVLPGAGLVFVRRLVLAKVLIDNHDVASAMIGNLGIVYAIVLGLVAVEVNAHFYQKL